jgi:uncharacterized protein with FMN-binding domain
MTARAITTRLGLALASTLLAAALLLGFQAPDDGSIAQTTGGDSAGALSAGTNASGVAAAGSTPRPTASTASTASGAAVVDGPVISTRFGPVQVEIKVSGGKLVSVTALELPSGGHSGRISSQAGPILASEALAAQSASIDTVSGATYTSLAYERSLQAALDQAGI